MVYKAEYRPSELLCPSSGRWVDFEVAKQRLDAYSPVRHCCALYVEGEGAASSGCDGGRHDDHDDDDDDVSNAGHTESQESSLVERIMLDIGGGGGGGGDNSNTSPPVGDGGHAEPAGPRHRRTDRAGVHRRGWHRG